MEIRINGQAADITIDDEKTVGDIMTALDKWLANSGHRLSGLCIDGQRAQTSSLEDFFSRGIDSVKTLDISTNSLPELAVQSIYSLLSDIQEYETLKFEDKNNYLQSWNESAQAKFTAEQMPDLYDVFVNLFSGNIAAGIASSLAEERMREINDPLHEFLNLQSLVQDTCTRLADLALDIQTGKDGRAAQTIRIFSGVAEKILRILKQLDLQGYLSNSEIPPGKPINQIINGFGVLLNDLLQAYEKHDTVLVGDLAEYEAAPRLQELYTVVLKNCRTEAKRAEK